MNLLIISRELPPIGGGAGNAALHLAQHLHQEGNKISLISMGFGGLPASEDCEGLSIYRVESGRKNQHSSNSIEMIRFVIGTVRLGRKIIAKEQFDIVHAHSVVPEGLAASILCQFSNLPFLITAHGSDVPGYNPDSFAFLHKLIKPVWMRVIKHAASIIAPSTYMADLIRRQKSDLNIEVIPNGVSTKALEPADKNHSFLIVSRLVYRKNYHRFLEALARIGKPQTVHIVGDGPLLPELKRLAATNPQHTIHFHGWLENGSVKWRTLYERCQFFVFPSSNENFPISLLEAQLAGMIVLASDIPGTREALGTHAIYFESLDRSGMLNTINNALAMGPTELQSMATAARERVLTKFSWEESALAYGRSLANILSRSRT